MADLYVANDKSEKKVDKAQPVSHSAPGRWHNPLSSFCYMPNNVKFETMETNERIVLFLRPHIITNIPWIIIAVVLLLAPSVLDSFPLLAFLPDEFQLVAVLGWYLVSAAFILEKFLTWFFNIYIMTDERLIDIDFYNLIYREISETKIDKIQDVTFKMGGAVRAIFNYGDVYIQTAGTVPNFDFMAVPNPNQVIKLIQEARSQEEQEVIEGRVR